MKKIINTIIGLLIIAITIIAIKLIFTTNSLNTYVYQEIQSNYFDNEIYLKTTIRYKGDVVEKFYDEINDNYNDTIKCYRYNKGVELINKLKRIDSVKCK